jgi:hypothetical protein
MKRTPFCQTRKVVGVMTRSVMLDPGLPHPPDHRPRPISAASSIYTASRPERPLHV